jgi:hypothetical protein
MNIVASARKHGIQDSDINHAVRHALRAFDLDGYTVLVGPDRHANLSDMKTTNDSKSANTDFKEMSNEEIEALRQRWLSGIPEADTEPCSFCLWMEQVEYKAQKKSLRP